MDPRPDYEETMKCWDGLREYFAANDPGGSHPRDVFESIIGQYDEHIDALAGALKKANTLLTRASLYTDLEQFKHEIAAFQASLGPPQDSQGQE